MQHSRRKLLLDIQISCEEIAEFTKGLTYEQFIENRMAQLATERAFEIIGEALTRLERLEMDVLEVNIPEYPKIIGFRKLIAHGYDTIDDASLWDFANRLVPDLLKKVGTYR